MPDLKISQLPVASTPLAGTELVPIVQGGVTDQTTVGAIMTSTVPSGTANGVLYLNGSKVATSGSALTFDGTALSRNGANTAVGVLVAGVSKAVRLGMDSTGGFIEGVDNTGFGSYQPLFVGGSETRFLVNYSEQMRLTSTGLGIGTSSPGYRLDVASGSGSLVRFTRGSIAMSAFIGAAEAFWGTDTNHPLVFTTNATEKMRLDSSGNLGLGVTPSAWGASWKALDIAENGAITALSGASTFATNAYNNGTNWIYKASSLTAQAYQQNSGEHRWLIAPSGTAGNAISFTQAMTLDASGNLGVGTTSPTTRVYAEGTISARSGTTGIQIYGTGGSGEINSVGANPLIFLTNASERARITSAGSFVAGGSVALATTATDGFLYVPTCAGTPTGTPTAITGMAPIVVDTTNNKMYFYSGGAWRDAGP